MDPTHRDASPSVLAKAAALLDAFDDRHLELGLPELVERTGLPRSTVHRTAAQMVSLGWLTRRGARYCVGNRLFELSGLVPVRLGLREAALPFLQDLYAATRVTVQLGVLHGTDVLCVEKIGGHQRLEFLSPVGGRIPAHCSSLGRAVLAHADADVVHSVARAGLAPLTSRTLVSEARWRRELAAVAERGYAVDREEGMPGVSCVGAPIWGPDGAVVAALSVTGPSRQVRPERLALAVKTAAAGTSRALLPKQSTVRPSGVG